MTYADAPDRVIYMERPLNTRPLWFIAMLVMLLIWLIAIWGNEFFMGATLWATMILTIVNTVKLDRSIRKARK